METPSELLPSTYVNAWSEDSFEDQFHIAMCATTMFAICFSSVQSTLIKILHTRIDGTIRYIDDFEGTYFRFQQHPKAILWCADTRNKVGARYLFQKIGIAVLIRAY